ncbi:hypothetical protein C8J34_12428, partial [Rhizobium sp. PP-F2F-G36]
ESFRLVLSNPTLPEITDGYEIQLHHSMGHDRNRYVVEALLPFKNKAAAALAVAERMNAGLASTVMGKLQYREG